METEIEEERDIEKRERKRIKLAVFVSTPKFALKFFCFRFVFLIQCHAL